ncbi:MAG: type II secretion system F family protein [Leptospiraceae bacterium]|nr:type II secretion system F family protein [Leptospiraceae bacterium]
MPIYRYTALNRKGKEEKGILDAGSVVLARKMLRAKGLYVRNIAEDEEKRERELFPFLTKFLYRVPRRDVALFARQLGTLLDAGLPLDRSLTNIIEQTENEYLKKALIAIKADVVEGEALSGALAKHSAIFPSMYSNLISVGEKTGTYEKALLRLADLEDANLAMKNKVQAALFYPIIMVALLGGIMAFLLAVVIPQIQMMFAQMDLQLPFITRFVLMLSDILTSWKILLVIGLIAGGVYAFQRYYATPEGRQKVESQLLRVPLVGNLLRKALLGRFARNLGVMLENRVPLITSLQVVSRVVDHSIFNQEIDRAIGRIKEGSRITDAFGDSVIVNQMILGMLSAGEASDNISGMVLKIADILDEDVNAAIQKFSTLLEPLMIIFMGGAIIVIMLAILLPIYDLTSQMQF